MCGITGIYSPAAKIDTSVLSAMTAALGHRGPDDSGMYIDDHGIGLGHTRLSIIDLSAKGRQPMSDNGITISYNGEIYNYREIKDDLAHKGHSFTSESDTEVVLKAYQQWGMDCLQKFIGMFAFAIWDARHQTLFLARDRAGVKPLYYYTQNGLFIFASELKAMYKHPGFVKSLDQHGLGLFLRYDYIRSPYTIFKNTFKLEPGHWLSVRDGAINKHRYWNVADCYNALPHAASEHEITAELEKILVDAFKYRLVADVPVGLFLSGGIDSSTVATLLQKNIGARLKTFTIGFNEAKHNEAHYAKRVAEYLQTDHTEHYISEREALDIVPQLPLIYDEPFADNSAIPTYLLSKIARQHVKVALSADGGDELFYGYHHYLSCTRKAAAFHKIPRAVRGAVGGALSVLTPEKLAELFNLSDASRFKHKYVKKRDALLFAKQNRLTNLYRHVMQTWSPQQIAQLLDASVVFNDDTFSEQFQAVEKAGLATQMMTADYENYLCDDILTKVDRATMRVGLEARDPFLDHHLVEFAARIPAQYKYRNGQAKYILKQVLAKHLPRDLFDRKKMGFGVPVNAWLRGELRPLAYDYLSETAINRAGIFNASTVSDWMDKFYHHGFDGKRIWNILVFQMWQERYLD